MSLYPKQLKFEESKRSALKGFAEEYSIKPPTDQKFDPKAFLKTDKQKAMEKLKPQTKVRLVLRTRMEQITKPAIAIKNFQSKTMVILASTDLNELWTVTENNFRKYFDFSNEWIWVDISLNCES